MVENIDTLQLTEIVNEICKGVQFSGDTLSVEQLASEYERLIDEVEEWKENDYQTEIDRLLDTFYPSNNFLDFKIPSENQELLVAGDSQNLSYSQKFLSFINEEDLISQGYSCYSVTDSSKVYYKYVTDSIFFIDTNTKICYSISNSTKVIENQNILNQHKVASNYIFGIVECVNEIHTLLKNFNDYKKKLYDTDVNDNNAIASTVVDGLDLFKDLLSSVNCYYEGIRNASGLQMPKF